METLPEEYNILKKLPKSQEAIKFDANARAFYMLLLQGHQPYAVIDEMIYHYTKVKNDLYEKLRASGSVAAPKELNEDQKLVHEVHNAHDLAVNAIDKLFDRLSSLKELVREREEALKELLTIAEDRLFSVPVTSLDEVEAIIERARKLLSK